MALNTSNFIIDYSAHGAALKYARRKKFGYALDERSTTGDIPGQLKSRIPSETL